jgi:hypothetical protein
LRLTSRWLSELATPHVFTSLTLDVEPWTAVRSSALVTGLAESSCNLSHHVRLLNIESLNPGHRLSEISYLLVSEENSADFLVSLAKLGVAISSLKNLRSIRYATYS